MLLAAPPDRPIRFGVFELDPASGELRRRGVPVRIGPQPFQVLLLLARRPRQLVTRKELRHELWGEGTFVDFENGINFCIKQLRDALDDDSKHPRYIETLPRRGYRFIAPTIASGQDGQGNGADTECALDEGQLGPEPHSAALHPSQAAVADFPQPVLAPDASTPAGRLRRQFTALAAAIAAVAILLVAGRVIHSYFRGNTQPGLPFGKFTIGSVTTTEGVAAAAISPDAKYLLLARAAPDGQALWLHNVATGGEARLFVQAAPEYLNLSFSPGGDFAYFEQPSGQSSMDVYRAPVVGGVAQLVARNVDSNVAFSPDGRRIAYIRDGSPVLEPLRLLTASLDGGGETTIYQGPRDGQSPALAWSPDGKRIAWSLRQPGEAAGGVAIFDFTARRARTFATFATTQVVELAWLPDGSGLLLNCSAGAEVSEIAYLSYPGARLRTVIPGTGIFNAFSLSADGRTIVAVQLERNFELDLLRADGKGAAVGTRALPAQIGIHKFAWDGNAHLLASEKSNLYRISVDGRSRSVLVHEAGTLIGFVSVCPADRSVVFNWFGHQGNARVNIWRAGMDGSNPMQLTSGRLNYAPLCSPDGKWVYFLTDLLKRTLMQRTPFGGGERAEVIPGSAVPNSTVFGWTMDLSPDGTELAGEIGVADSGTGAVRPKLEVVHLVSGRPPLLLDPDGRIDGGPMFTPDSKALAYPIREEGTSRVWAQPLNGAPGRPLTPSAPGWIIQFSWSPNAEVLGVLRERRTSEAVLLRAQQP